ncbi:MAG: AAA domain (dynein-related subfamily) [Candidatus Electronema aureum]|uniref:AAA domain (Dynein-related subfamily) n=1 Tax=Candidatus Electronema aureum TaxID=2005002 RepID=A0A521G2U9_9BACT|nr:MAG: AAA domain (dynein-related subfamily) [Candidatus Electronema aureum]
MNSSHHIPKKIRVAHRIKLERCQSWEEGFHVFDEESALAVEMALATGRPLLVRGEPGSGKSQLARAAAQELNRRFISEVITSTTEGQNLLWHYDPVARFHEAQMLAAEAAATALRQENWEEDNQADSEEIPSVPPQPEALSRKKSIRYKKKKILPQKRQHLFQAISAGAGRGFLPDRGSADLHPGNSISPGPFWWAIDCVSARQQIGRCRWPLYQPGFDLGFSLEEAAAQAQRGFVFLIDEIDKADSSLPNALLEVLGNGGFHVPLLNQTVRVPPGFASPLVIITTNEERELPPAFVRRCLVLHLRFDDEHYLRTWWNRQVTQRADQFHPDRALVKWLAERGELHFEHVFSVRVREKAAELLVRDRREAQQAGLIKPGQAEYLDLLRALRNMAAASSEQQQLALLEQISPYVFIKEAQE